MQSNLVSPVKLFVCVILVVHYFRCLLYYRLSLILKTQLLKLTGSIHAMHALNMLPENLLKRKKANMLNLKTFINLLTV